MEYVDPIKDVESINAIKKILSNHSQRDLLLFVFGINTGLRISDLLALKLSDVWEDGRIKEFLLIQDEKNGEEKAYYINSRIQEELLKYLALARLNGSDYLFKSKKDNLPITRQQAYRIINHAARQVGIPGKIGTHTLRKTFGYHAFRAGVAVSILMKAFHHHSPSETLKYIGINKEETRFIKVNVNL
ncbi:MAG: tyrosine-type recombinase/integrase [Desulfitobacterium hafniense]|uniref:tyrosine-type recombinase/integrase n=1 Tax=Desulfitobacterium hafniense TaxID=49338 RepID=UPI000368F2E9|nr:tyrosine-type recombinase/integrase [Desulfitobacterium hafniense]